MDICKLYNAGLVCWLFLKIQESLYLFSRTILQAGQGHEFLEIFPCGKQEILSEISPPLAGIENKFEDKKRPILKAGFGKFEFFLAYIKPFSR